MPDLIIFDCDGVLLESEVLSCSSDAIELTRAGFPYSTEEIAERFLGMALPAMLKAIEREHGRQLPPGFDRHLKRTIAARFDDELTTVDGIEAVLADLTKPCCVASGSDLERLRHSLGLVGLGERFAPHIFSAEQVENGKPAPDLFLHAAQAMSVAPPACLVIEDSRAGVTAGRAAGMNVVGFFGGSHCPPGHGERLIEAGAHKVFNSMHELPSLVDAFG
ncbi:MAG: HAD family hydrolase [Alphaproteobacteria bacterium]|nr:HAD family hydrolase [Rhodospirillaceae bacterium]MDG2479649.1 HAD family hydrolase [Alphaproteobacteria bacterium]MBT6205646.1 HAD family hydrolase [Rhodospirillaceae bacterium]MBT6512223.1 HAD family hydrolase [Rhodospirillaceae bacterium]MBT7615405.1 HAD family hydrolase [Rhodospirillaceae bacterium]